MKKILGLDLGTSSIGWAVVNQAESQSEKSEIIRLGVRVNPLTTDEKGNFESGKSITTTAERTQKRGMRRNTQRYKQRRNNLIEALKAEGIISESTLLSEDGKSSTFSTLRTRAKAAREEITLEEFARVLININKKRGYKSNRKANNSEDGEIFDGMAVARELRDKGITPGEHTFQRLTDGKGKVQYYKSDLQNEFDRIWQTQSTYYPEILDADTRRKVEGKNRIETRAIFFAAHHLEAQDVKDKKIKQLSYSRWRAEALKSKIEIGKVVTALSEVNGAISSASGYLGAICDHSKELEINGLTVGEYLYRIVRNNPNSSLKNIVFYRNDYINEFNIIWNEQAKHHPELTEQLKAKISAEIIFFQRRLKSQKGLVAFCEFESKQIELPSGKKVTSGPRVCPKSSPLYQEFKIWQDLNNLIIEDKTVSRKVTKTKFQNIDEDVNRERYFSPTKEQKQMLYNELYCKDELLRKEILKILGLNEREYSINFKKLQGNTTQVGLLNAYKNIIEQSGHDLENFDKLNSEMKLEYVKSIFTMLGSDCGFLQFDANADNDEMQQNKMFRLWHLLYSYEDDNTSSGNGKLVDHISALTGLPKEYSAVLTRVAFTQDFGSLSSKAIRKILPFMKDGKVYSEACKLAGYRHSSQSLSREEIENKPLLSRLEILPKNSLRNPVVEKILNQMIHVVNGCISEYGTFDEIHIEMARELKQNKKKREEAYKALNDRTRKTEAIKKIVADITGNPNPSRNDIIKYRLYEELAFNGYRTLYSNTPISREELFSRKFDIEHIIPQARVFDDSISNKTLEARGINIEKDKMTAIDYVAMKYGEEGVNEYLNRVAHFNKEGSRKKYINLTTTATDIKSDFLNRELSDSQFIAKKAKEMLLQVAKVVVPTIGQITARLREDWQLVDIMKELNWDKYDKLGLTSVERNRDGHEVRHITDWTKRNDHRHHAMDALTIAFTRPSHIQYLNNLNAQDDGEKKDSNIYGIERKELIDGKRFVAPMPLKEFRAEAMRQLNSILVSIKAKNKVTTRNSNKIKGGATQHTQTPRGQLHNDTVYGRRRKYVTRVEKVGASFDESKIATVSRKDYREALLRRLNEFDGDPKKAFTQKNSPVKNPIYTNESHTSTVPEKVATVALEEYFIIRKPINAELSIDKVVDDGIRRILLARKEAFGGDAKKAFSNLDENPIWINKEKGIVIKRVTIKGANDVTPLHKKMDKDGRTITDLNGRNVPTDYVSTSNNHHIAIFEDADGNLQEHVVSFFEATASKNLNLPVVDKNFNNVLGWKFLFTMKKNEYFVFPSDDGEFNPAEIDLFDPKKQSEISPHLFRVQTLSTRDYTFRHHLETTVEKRAELRDITWKRIKTTNKLRGVVKVRVNHLGTIVEIVND